jgi:mannose-6-phosphate isomerase-like protein (cupin superfamily)
MKRRRIALVVLVLLALVPAALLMLQLSGGRGWSIPVSGDPGVSWMLVTDTPDYRVLRDFARPGATRRMHHHDATWHVLTLATGTLVLTVEGSSPVELAAGQSYSLEGGVQHTFSNPGTVTATIVEVFGKTQPE